MNQLTSVLKYLIDNQVILPVSISLALAYVTLRRQTVTEEDENFIRLKEQFRDLWSTIVIEDDKLMKVIDEIKEEKAKLHSFQLVEFFYMVWFLNYRRKSQYREQWDQNMDHVFTYPLIRTTFLKHSNAFDVEYQNFIKSRYLND